MIHIYKITNRANGKIYIGQTHFPVKVRLATHFYNARKNRGCIVLTQAIRKHGSEQFCIESLSTATNTKDANKLEISMIELFKSNTPEIGYNVSLGGNGARGFKWRQESRLRLSKTMKGNLRGLGRVRTEESRNKTRLSLLGHSVSEETRKRIRAGMARVAMGKAS